MDVTQTTATAPQASNPAPAARPALSSDFETFLRMLTVQMQNQDPLNPIESSDFAVQLATFSGVEQQVRTNDLLRDLADGMGGGAVSRYADWIGKEARIAGPAHFDGSPLTVSTRTVIGTEAADLIVRDQSGRIVDRLPIDPRGGNVVWSGVAQTGQRFLTGRYDFTVESRAGDAVIAETPGETYARVTEARVTETGQIDLLFAGGGSAPASSVTGLRLAR